MYLHPHFFSEKKRNLEHRCVFPGIVTDCVFSIFSITISEILSAFQFLKKIGHSIPFTLFKHLEDSEN